MQSPTLLLADYQALSKEAGRRNSEVRDAADKAYSLLKNSPSRETTIAELQAEPLQTPSPLFQPIFLASATRNAKVIALAVTALQRLTTASLVPRALVKQILETLEAIIPQGVEIQLKILQTLVSLLTSPSPTSSQGVLVQGEDLGVALELSHRLSTSKIPVVASTASATLRQLFMFVFERLPLEDSKIDSLPPPSFHVDVPSPEHDAAGSAPPPTADDDKSKSISLHPAARDAYLLLEDLCLLIANSGEARTEGEPSFLKWSGLSRTFGLELVESIVSGFGTVVRSHPELLLVLRAHLCPLLLRLLPPPAPGNVPNSFPLTLRLTRVIFLLLKSFSDLLPLESEIFLSIFVKVISEGDGWMRVLGLEIWRGLCGDFGLVMKVFERYDMKGSAEGGSMIFSSLMAAFNRLATQNPSILGVGSAVLYGSSLQPYHGTSSTSGTSLGVSHPAGSASTSSLANIGGGIVDSAMEMGFGLAQAVASTSAVAGSGGGLSVSAATLKLQCIDQLDKADAPPIPETYVFLLVLQCLASLADGFAAFTLGSGLGEQEKEKKLNVVRGMADASWPALLASLSFFISTDLDDDLFGDVVAALQNFTSVCGVLGLATPREAFLTSLCKFSIPPSVVSQLAASADTKPTPGPTTATSVLTAGAESLGLSVGHLASTAPPGLSSRNLVCLRATISVAQYLAGSLGAIWFAVFETLQNAEFVLKSSAGRGKKKSTTPAPPSPMKGGAGANAKGDEGRIPVLPTEADELAVQASIAKLFEVSKGLDDEAFKSFVGALARLSGEMIGVAMTEEGEPLGAGMGGSTAGSMSPGGSGSRRRASGISSMRTLRLDEKSFGVSKLGVVSLLNVHRLIYRESTVGWDLVTSHLLHVQHYSLAPSAIRLQAADVLDQILLVAPKNLSTGGDELQRRIQTQVLTALEAQAEPALRPQSSTDVEIRRMAFETLIKILESNGHSFIAGWERIFHILRTACPSGSAAYMGPPSPGASGFDLTHNLDKIDEDDDGGNQLKPGGSYFGAPDRVAKTPVLVRTSFPSLQLICTDFLGALTIDELKDCIGTLSEFGKQTDDVNVALTSGGLLWSVSDHLQAKRKDGDNEVAHGELWMFLLHQLLALSQDPRQEARDGAITTIFRSISLYGSTLSKSTWDACFWDIVFPLLDSLSTTIAKHNKEFNESETVVSTADLVVQVNGPPIRLLDKQWDDSKTLALKSMGNVFFEYLPKIVRTSRYEETWAAFVGHLKRSFVEDRPQAATASMQSLEKVLSVALDGAEVSRIASSWEVAWAAWDEIGHAIVALSHPPAGGNAKTFTQINLEAYVKVALPIYTPPYITFDLTRIHRLLAILKAVLTYTRSPDFRPDVDSLTPLQASILEVVAAIKLEIPGAASAVLSDLSEYLTLAFIAAFDSEGETSIKSRPRVTQRVSYIALTKEVMPHVLWLFQRYKEDASIYDQGAVERMLAAYALPLKLKHDCPAPSKFGSDQLLWKTATVNFLKAVRDTVVALQTLGPNLPTATFEGIWRHIVDGFRGALLADSNASAEHHSAEEQHEEENFDLALLASIEQDVVPYIGNALVPDELIKRLGKCLQTASRLYELDLPNASSSLNDNLSSADSIMEADVGHESTKETRFDSDFDRQATGEMFGTTAEVVEVGRERFGYWCFDLLFLLCSDVPPSDEEELEDVESGPERRRIATLCLPFLLNRCSAVIKTYVADAPLRGKMPFPRIRQEELIFVLQKLINCRLHQGALWASSQPEPSKSILSLPPLEASTPIPQLVRSALLRSPLAHLYEFHPLFTSLLSLSTQSPSITSAYIPYRRTTGDGLEDSVAFKGLPEGFKIQKIGRTGHDAEATDIVHLTLAALTKVGTEIGAGVV
ncbi:endosomal peripheral membrane protein [Pseudohyphozyma bogoriensis]|nr:endosomal peripheral membrane protein [Pseudohyphozyma bogoriensis]